MKRFINALVILVMLCMAGTANADNPGARLSGSSSVAASSGGPSTNPVSIAQGGTGQTAKTDGFDALAPTTTKGDAIVYDGTDNVRLPVGAAGFTPVANSNSTAGLNWFDQRKHSPITSGRYLVGETYAAVTTVTIAQNSIFFSPVLVTERTTFTATGFASVVVTAISQKTGIYADLNGKPTGLPISGTTVTTGPLTTATVTNQDATYASPVTLDPGWYWLAILTDGSGTYNAISNVGMAGITGSADMTASTGSRLAYSTGVTYAAGLPDMTSNTASEATSNRPYMGLKKQ